MIITAVNGLWVELAGLVVLALWAVYRLNAPNRRDGLADHRIAYGGTVLLILGTLLQLGAALRE